MTEAGNLRACCTVFVPGVSVGSQGARQLCPCLCNAGAVQPCFPPELNSNGKIHFWVTCSMDGSFLSCPAWIWEYPRICVSEWCVSHQHPQELGSPRKLILYSVYFSIPSHTVTQHCAAVQTEVKWILQTPYHWVRLLEKFIFCCKTSQTTTWFVLSSIFPEMVIRKDRLEHSCDFPCISGFQKKQFPLLSHPDGNVNFIYGHKMEVEMQKLWYKTSLCC